MLNLATPCVTMFVNNQPLHDYRVFMEDGIVCIAESSDRGGAGEGWVIEKRPYNLSKDSIFFHEKFMISCSRVDSGEKPEGVPLKH
jgi:hypothetical protein